MYSDRAHESSWRRKPIPGPDVYHPLPRPEGLEADMPAKTYLVWYPTNGDFKAVGVFIPCIVKGKKDSPAIDLTEDADVFGSTFRKGSIIQLDPSATVTDEAGKVVYRGIVE